MALLQKYLTKQTETAPLAVFRCLFGLMMLGSLVRFWGNGWIEHLYIEPKFFFSYYGFSWVKPIGESTYFIFLLCGIASLMVALGFFYRLGIIAFFLSFTYIELMDKTTYLNHYYFISAMAFLLIFLPANATFSLDAWRNPNRKKERINAWCVDSVKLMLGIVYFFAGLAKLNSDWLLEAMPLGIWLSTKTDLPLIGSLMNKRWFHYSLSWSGAVYDLFIPFFLLYRSTRIWAYLAVIFFHLLTGWLFPIGMFPYVMIVSTLIFFPASFHQKIIDFVGKSWGMVRQRNWLFTSWFVSHEPIWCKRLRLNLFPTIPKRPRLKAVPWFVSHETQKKVALATISLFFIIQLALPFRYLAYPDELFWTEEGFRFSWRVMLMEKAGYAQFKVINSETGRRFYVDNSEFLTPFQEKQMSFQPDFILEYAHFLAEYYRQKGIVEPQIYVESYVALNGRSSQPYVNPNVDLAKVKDTFAHKNWILPFGESISGL